MTDKNAPDVDVIVTVDHSHLARIQEIAVQLEAKGLKVEQMLDSIGAIAGKAKVDAIAKMSKVAGVLAVEPSGEVRIAPPGSDIQ